MNSFNSRSTLRVGNQEYEIYRLDALDQQGISTRHLPYSLRILLENLLRTEDGRNVTAGEIRALAAWNRKSKPDKEIAFTPSRVLLQDFTGVPAVVSAQQGALCLPALGADGFAEPGHRAPRYRHRSPSQSRIPGARRFRAGI
jgi:aconitate hydratase